MGACDCRYRLDWVIILFYRSGSQLEAGKNLPAKAHGQAWQVHGGGFYNMVKYLVAPTRMPDELTWFKWEAYGTWISGIALMSLVYYGAASLYMIDLEIFSISELQAIAISLAGIVLGWVVYDGLCRSPLGRNDVWLAIAGFVFLVGLAYGYGQIFRRAARSCRWVLPLGRSWLPMC